MDQRHASRRIGDVAEFEVVIDNIPIPGRKGRKGRATLRARHDLSNGSLSLESSIAAPGSPSPAKVEISLDSTSRGALTDFLANPPER